MSDYVQPEPTVENGYVLGRPEGRDVEELDRIIEEAIEKLPMAARLYPDVYAWRISEAVKEHYINFCNSCSGPYDRNSWPGDQYSGHWDTCPNRVRNPEYEG